MGIFEFLVKRHCYTVHTVCGRLQNVHT